MIVTREQKSIPRKCLDLEPSLESKQKSGLLGSNSKAKDVDRACTDGCSDAKERINEITDYNFNSLTNTGYEGSTKRTTICGANGSSTIKKSLNGPLNASHSCLYKFASRIDKKSKLYQMINKGKGCKVCPTSLETLMSQNLNKKYITSKDSYNLKVVNDIIYNENSHIVTVFKEYLIFDDISEFLKRFYHSSETAQRLRKVNDYYAKYSKVFPNYFLFKESKYMFKNIKRKQRWIDDQQKNNADAQQRARKAEEEEMEDRLFTTNCIIEINKTDSILGQSQRVPDSKDPETRMQSYLKSQESIKGGHTKDVKGAPRVEDMGLQELVERFILKDSISVINMSQFAQDCDKSKEKPKKGMEARISLDKAANGRKNAVLINKVSNQKKDISGSRSTSKPRNLRIESVKEAWAETSKDSSSHRAGAYPARASSVALASIPKQLASTSKNGLQYAEVSVEKPGTARSHSHDKCAAANALLHKNTGKKELENEHKAVIDIKGNPLNSGAATTKGKSGEMLRRSKSSTATKSGTHSRNPNFEKQGGKGFATNATHKATKPVEGGLATTRSSSHKETTTRGKTTSQTPRTSIERKSVGATSSGRQGSVNKTKPMNNVQKAINCFLSGKDTPGVLLRASHEIKRESGSKLRNLKGVAIDLESTNQKLQKHIPGPQTMKPKADGQTPGHARRYKSDYLNSLTNNQNVPTSLLHHGQSKLQQKAELRTPPDLISKITPSLPLGAVLRADTALGSYTTSHGMGRSERPTLTARDDNKKLSMGRTGDTHKPGGKMQANMAKLKAQRVPCV